MSINSNYVSLCNVTIYTVTQKRDPDIFDCNFKMDQRILTIFGRNIPETTGHQTALQLLTSPSICFYTTWGKQNKRDITFYTRHDFIKITRVDHIWFTFRSLWLTVYPDVQLFNCYSQRSICRPFARTQARRRFLRALIAVSIMFCSRPIQISTSRFWSSSTFLNVV